MNIGELLVNVITVLLFYFFISRTFTLRRLHWIYRGIGLMLLFVLITLLNLMNIAPTITCVSGLICQILYTMVFAEGSRGARLLIGGIPALLAVVSDSVTFSVLGILFQDTSEALTDQFCHSQSGSGHIHTHLLPPNLGSHSILPAGFEIPGIF